MAQYIQPTANPKQAFPVQPTTSNWPYIPETVNQWLAKYIQFIIDTQ